MIDFAGETVIHLSSAGAALACVLVIGKRIGHGAEEYHPHNLPMTLLGAGILWFGWFGFNGGSALSSGHLAAQAFLNTHFAAAAGMLSWLLLEAWRFGKPTSLGAASGAVAGLVGITPAAGFVGPLAAMIIGVVVGGACFFGVQLKGRLGLDDALDVLGIHGVGGVFGLLLTGLLASVAVNSAGANGLLHGNPKLLLVEAVGIVVRCRVLVRGDVRRSQADRRDDRTARVAPTRKPSASTSPSTPRRATSCPDEVTFGYSALAGVTSTSSSSKVRSLPASGWLKSSVACSSATSTIVAGMRSPFGPPSSTAQPTSGGEGNAESGKLCNPSGL